MTLAVLARVPCEKQRSSYSPSIIRTPCSSSTTTTGTPCSRSEYDVFISSKHQQRQHYQQQLQPYISQPRGQQEKEKEEKEQSQIGTSVPFNEGSVTTLMIRNIPTKFTSSTLLRVIQESGFKQTFDFFYLPMDFRTGKNVGYAFINFINNAYAVTFASLFDGQKLRPNTSQKELKIYPSRLQGARENIELMRGSKILSSANYKFKPFVSLRNEPLVPFTEEIYHQLQQSWTTENNEETAGPHVELHTF